MPTNCIVVGVDGSAGARAALIWAADECRLRGRTLLVVHGADHVDAPPGGEAGERILSSLLAAASARQPGVAVTSLDSRALAADALIDLSRDADLLVVGTHGRGGIVSSILGSVSHRVAAHASCPVVVVPDMPGRGSDARSSRVVVGVSESVSGRLAADFAFDEARRRGATLVAVHAGDGSTQAGFAEQARHYPDVMVESVIADADPADALLAAAGTARLLVVGCHHSDDRWSTRLGPVPVAILHRAPCPVVVVGQWHPALAESALNVPGHDAG